MQETFKAGSPCATSLRESGELDREKGNRAHRPIVSSACNDVQQDLTLRTCTIPD